MEIPDVCSILIAVCALFQGKPHLTAALLPFVIHLFSALLSALFNRQTPIGFGDIKLFSAIGLNTGVFFLLKLFAVSFVLSGFYAVAFLLLAGNKKEAMKSCFPLCPFIALAYTFFWIRGF